jgi:ubiquinone/menaquinone biosynthesis C-methylase UbiE
MKKMITRIFNWNCGMIQNMKAITGYYNTHNRQKKWINVALDEFQQGASYSWGKALEDEDRLGDYVKIRDEFLIPNSIGKTVLELGCLDGKWSQYIVPVAKHTTLVDLSKDILPVLEKRIKKVGGDYTFYETKGFELNGVADGTIDLIFSMDTLVRVNKKFLKKYFSEFRRILKMDGKLLLHLPCITSPMSKRKKFVMLSPTHIADYMYSNGFKEFQFDFYHINHGVLLLYGF